uniref:Uncharacterized protein n=1 Tax=mine drainage metagenome TaxID=410659 RepID=E6QX35_9ZZZZ
MIIGSQSYSKQLPPASSIAARAPLVADMPRNDTTLDISPFNTTLAERALIGTRPESFSTCKSMSEIGNLFKAESKTSTVWPAVIETKPRLGRRR